MTDGRILVGVQRQYIDIEDLLNGKTVDEVLEEFQTIFRRHEKEIIQYDYDVRFQVERYGYDGGMEFVIETKRWETDEEYQSRLKAEKAQQEKFKQNAKKRKAKALAKALETEADERALYKKLKSKFESV